MKHENFKDTLFEILNETDMLPISDIETDDKNSTFKVTLDDKTQFIIKTEPNN